MIRSILRFEYQKEQSVQVSGLDAKQKKSQTFKKNT